MIAIARLTLATIAADSGVLLGMNLLGRRFAIDVDLGARRGESPDRGGIAEAV
ncbi:hypothetical protein [Caulobacter sp. AP07]|uniref:hypothetical protein n=1 Tax=Caulobacter sp. AP07 TaxID=1144304 RepID=UPI001EE68233|nr:hypothetical protein [Caulobacter sp. AP07]